MKRTRKILPITGMVCALAAIVLFGLPFPVLLQDGTADTLLKGALVRTGMIAFVVFLALFSGQKSLFRFEGKTLPRALLWGIPCLLVAIVNFPFSALLTGGAKVIRPDLLPLYAFYILTVGVSEEFLFRGIFHTFCKEALARRKNGYLSAVLLSSAIFGLIHLFNLCSGANVGATFLQVGYSFLIGAMLAVTYDKTGNLWLCAVLHSLFDFGGLLILSLGEGNAQDAVFWILTVVVGVLCGVHILLTALKENRRRNRALAKEQP